jgi:4-hydroxy-tetrahydrodipicolinate reductase
MKLAIIGYGKMGRIIESTALARNHEIEEIIGIDKKEHLSDLLEDNIDVAIEFTTPDSAVYNISQCLHKNVPVVSGTTGWLQQRPQIDKLVEETNGAFFYASNFSIGVNLFFELNSRLAHMMAAHHQYDVEIEETHHIHKLDSPSGTAITLAEEIIKNIPGKTEWVKQAEKSRNDLVIKSIRKDEVPGTHRITYQSEEDRIEIRHEAFNRSGFALGAIMAAEWLQGKKGVFTMKDMLGSL